MSKTKKTFSLLVTFCLYLLLAFVVSSGIKMGKTYFSNRQPYLVNAPENSVAGRVLAEEMIMREDPMGLVLASEDYKMEQINIGGDFATEIMNRENDAPITVSDAKSSVVSDRDSEEIKLLLQWKTNKPTLSQVEYGKTGENGTKSVREDDYGYSHSVVITDLEASSVYNYTIHLQDNLGNLKDSEKYVFYTGAPKVSLVDLLENAAFKAFGWAMGK